MKKTLTTALLAFTVLVSLFAAPEQDRTMPGARVVADLKKHYSMPGRKVVRAVYAGKPRTFTETDGTLPVDVRAHLVSADVSHSPCGALSRETWEVHYHRTGEEWHFRRLQFKEHREIGKPKKKVPYLPDADAKSLIDSEFSSRKDIQVLETVIEEKKGTRTFCVPVYAVRARSIIAVKDGLMPVMRTFDCRVLAVIRNDTGDWQVTELSCLAPGAKKQVKMPCTFASACRELKTESTLAGPDRATALALIRQELLRQYAVVRDRAEITRFEMIRPASKKDPVTKIEVPDDPPPRERNGTVIPYVIASRLVLDEREYYDTDVAGAAKKTYRWVRAVYDCVIRARLVYSFEGRRWKAEIVSCCSSEEKDCGEPCSFPSRGCKKAGNR